MKRLVSCGLAAAAVLAMSGSAFAAPIVGTLNITGSVRVSSGNLDWEPPIQPTGTIGTFTTKSPGTDYFANIVGPVATPTVGDSKDVSFIGAPNYSPVTLGATSVTNFLDNFVAQPIANFPTYDNLFFDLTAIVAPTSPACTAASPINSVCSIGPFAVIIGPNGLGLVMGVLGFFEDSDIADSRNDYVGIYTTQLVGYTIGGLLNILAGTTADPACVGNPAPGVLCTSYSANFTAISEVPEPATLLTFGAGAALLAFRRRRKVSA